MLLVFSQTMQVTRQMDKLLIFRYILKKQKSTLLYNKIDKDLFLATVFLKRGVSKKTQKTKQLDNDYFKK
ncbi:hypothetical protein L950_0210470 [Sphingobacterium sp. IITKGP-BTPF85]|nr:hypothetical protein L950_0210470 [Sphingobacterium sp. IITKGP-BTPF85]